MKIKIYFDRVNDRLTFTKHKHIVAKPVAVVQVPDGTRKDGDCVVLPDEVTTVFKNRRVSATELYIRANNNWPPEVFISQTNLRNSTFAIYGKEKKSEKVKS